MGADRVIRCYDIRRPSTNQKEDAICLCERHLEARKVLEWVVDGERESLAPVPSCGDCREAQRQPSVIDRVIDSDDDDTEPAPVPVLPGQRRLF